MGAGRVSRSPKPACEGSNPSILAVTPILFGLLTCNSLSTQERVVKPVDAIPPAICLWGSLVIPSALGAEDPRFESWWADSAGGPGSSPGRRQGLRGLAVV